MTTWQRAVARIQWAVTPPWTKRAALKEITDILESWPETAEMLAFARDKGVPINFDSGLIGGTVNGVFTRSDVPGRTRIGLKPGAPAAQAAATLVHELRHLWQSETLGLGGENLRGEYSTPMTKILVTRVMEADAFAFAHTIATRINRMGDDLHEAASMATDLAKISPTGSLTPRQIERINRHFREKTGQYPAQDVAAIRSRFFKELDDLDSYDRRALRKYHALYTHPHLSPKEKTPMEAATFELSNLRRVLRFGDVDYMAGVSDSALLVKIMSPVADDVKQTARLMQIFETAAARGDLDAHAHKAARKDIHAHMKSVNDVKSRKKLSKKPD